MSIQERGLLVNLSVRQWSARKYDRKVSKEVTSQYGVSADSGRWNKVLLAQDKIKAIASLCNDLRTWHYKVSLPWTDEGYRILPIAMYVEHIDSAGEAGYMAEFNRRKGEIMALVEEFIQVYPSLKDQARSDLGSMFQESDYPSEDKLRGKYEVNVSFLPIPCGNGDFRVQISDNQLERLRADVKSQVLQAEQAAMSDVWGRLRRAVSHMVDKLKDPAGRFHDTLTGNVLELCELLPKLNISGDVELDRIAKDLIEKCSFTPDDLRKKPMIRQLGAAVGAGALNAIDARLKEMGLT